MPGAATFARHRRLFGKSIVGSCNTGRDKVSLETPQTFMDVVCRLCDSSIESSSSIDPYSACVTACTVSSRPPPNTCTPAEESDGLGFEPGT